MRSPARLFIVLVSLLPSVLSAACFDARPGDGGPDASTSDVDDASASCRQFEASVIDLSCEVSATGEAFATIMSAPQSCCSSGSVTPTVTHDGNAHDVELAWVGCACCETCRCVGPIETTRVALGRLQSGTHVVRAHGSSCTVVAPTEASCSPAPADEVRLARVLLAGQPLVATVIAHEPSGCSCTPRIAAPDLTLEVCDCCEACECVDPGYEAGIVLGLPAVGEHSVVVPEGVATVTVIEREACRPLAPTGLRIVSPDPNLVSSGPRLTWAVVTGTERLCCADPAPAVDQAAGPEGEIALTLLSCVQTDCACVGEEVPFEAWHALGEFGAGTRTVRAGAFAATFTATP